jgi:TM2 domain-containing membrane protein YozV
LKQFLILISFLFCSIGSAQTSDSVVVKNDSVVKKLPKDSRPRNAAILSAVIPGLGQIYNGKYWKTPIVWAAMGGFGYFFIGQLDSFTVYHKDVKALALGDSASVIHKGFSIDQLQTQKIIFRKHRDLLGFALIAVYAIQIIDANVDAHLRTFDVSDDLSLRLSTRPVIVGSAWGPGLSLRLNFK